MVCANLGISLKNMRKLVGNHNLYKLALCMIITLASSPQVYSHEELFNNLVIYHPYLIKESETEALGFLSIENTDSKSEYLLNIQPQFSSEYKLWKRGMNEGDIEEVDLHLGVEIPPGEAIYIDQDFLKLSFLGLDASLDWFDEHIAIFVFKEAGSIELDFEVEQ